MMTVYNCKVTESMVNFAIIHGELLDNFTTLDCLESDFCSNTIEASRLSGVHNCKHERIIISSINFCPVFRE